MNCIHLIVCHSQCSDMIGFDFVMCVFLLSGYVLWDIMAALICCFLDLLFVAFFVILY